MKLIVVNNKPAKESLKKHEEYYFCACSQSDNQPFCDGPYEGISFKLKLFLELQRKNLICANDSTLINQPNN
jgi:CDGSH-type Zn-finger protein